MTAEQTGRPAAADWRRYESAVRDYFADCELAAAELAAAGSCLDRRWHPTADGAVKMIPHHGDSAEAAKIRLAFRAVLTSRLTSPAVQPETELEVEAAL
jgi:hypothetical protein